MSSVAFGVQDSNGIGTTAPHIRQMLKYKWTNQGIVGGLTVTGQTSLKYYVTAGMAICTKGSSDGYTEAFFEGGYTPEVGSNSGSNPRIDVIWIAAHDITQGDSDNLVTLGVTSGNAAASPSIPEIPSYALAIAYAVVPASSTTTSGVVVTRGDDAIPYGASLGVLANETNTTNGEGTSGMIYAGSVVVEDSMTMCSTTISIPSERTVRIDMLTTAKTGSYTPLSSGDGSMHLALIIDGETIVRWERILHSTVTCESMPYTKVLSEGSHTISLEGINGISNWEMYYSWSNGCLWPGQVLTVTDVGVG